MEKMPGVQLGQVWPAMKLADKMQLQLNLATHQETWLSVSFRQYGGLYYTEDLGVEPSKDYLYTDQKGNRVFDSRFAIGPMMGRDWSDSGRATVKCDRGPCKEFYPTSCAKSDHFQGVL